MGREKETLKSDICTDKSALPCLRPLSCSTLNALSIGHYHPYRQHLFSHQCFRLNSHRYMVRLFAGCSGISTFLVVKKRTHTYCRFATKKIKLSYPILNIKNTLTQAKIIYIDGKLSEFYMCAGWTYPFVWNSRLVDVAVCEKLDHAKFGFLKIILVWSQ